MELSTLEQAELNALKIVNEIFEKVKAQTLATMEPKITAEEPKPTTTEPKPAGTHVDETHVEKEYTTEDFLNNIPLTNITECDLTIWLDKTGPDGFCAKLSLEAGCCSFNVGQMPLSALSYFALMIMVSMGISESEIDEEPFRMSLSGFPDSNIYLSIEQVKSYAKLESIAQERERVRHGLVGPRRYVIF